MAFDNSLFREDAGYYLYKGIWLTGKFVPNARLTMSKKAVDAALSLELEDSDILFATYPKTGITCISIHIELTRIIDNLCIINGSFTPKTKSLLTHWVLTH